jgi:hypothetical protein
LSGGKATGTSGKGRASGVDGMSGIVGRLWPAGRRGRGNGWKLFEGTGNVRRKLRGKGNGRSGNGTEY